MSVNVMVTTEGHRSLDEIKDALEAAGCGPVNYRVTSPGFLDIDIMPLHATFSLRDPKVAQNREISVLHRIGVDRDEGRNSHIDGEEYTFLSIGSFDGGPDIMRALGQAFGGCMEDEADESEELFPTPSAPAP